MGTWWSCARRRDHDSREGAHEACVEKRLRGLDIDGDELVLVLRFEKGKNASFEDLSPTTGDVFSVKLIASSHGALQAQQYVIVLRDRMGILGFS